MSIFCYSVEKNLNEKILDVSTDSIPEGMKIIEIGQTITFTNNSKERMALVYESDLNPIIENSMSNENSKSMLNFALAYQDRLQFNFDKLEKSYIIKENIYKDEIEKITKKYDAQTNELKFYKTGFIIVMSIDLGLIATGAIIGASLYLYDKYKK